jgi:YcaO-like protein with predicted kinase domain
MSSPAIEVSAERAGAKRYLTGTHRVVSPETTLARVRPFLPVMGITRIANVTGLDHIGIPVVMVCRPNARSISVSQGKGVNLAAAKASGAMEAIECYHAEHITLPLKYLSYEEMRYSHRVADPETLALTRASIFHPNLPLLWIQSQDLVCEESIWIPYELVSLNFTLPGAPGMGCFVSGSNGLASGNHSLEAISHGICEVVERDAVTLWSLKRETEQQATRINLDSISDQDCRSVLDKYEKAGMAVGVWQATSDVRIAVFIAMIVERERNPARPLPGAFCYGCHPCREVALLRALTEVAQSRLTLISGSRDDISWSRYESQAHWTTWEIQRDLLLGKTGNISFLDAPTFNGDTLKQDVSWELERLAAAGFDQVLSVDLTRSEFGIPVARVVIPGLEPKFSEKDYRPGRRARALLP